MLSSFATTLAEALAGRPCSVQKRETDWNFNFGEGRNIAVLVPWRVVTTSGIAHGDEDDAQQFGLPARVNGEARTNELLADRSVTGVIVDEHTADLQINFDEGVRVDLFNNSAAYEGWQAKVPSADGKISIIALGGGELAAYLG